MKLFVYLVFLFLITCTNQRTYYSILPLDSEQIYSLEKVFYGNGYKPIRLEKIQGIIIDVSYLESHYLRDSMLKKLEECDFTKYVRIDYSPGTIKNDFAPELSKALSEMEGLKEVFIGLDSAHHIPKLLLKNSQIEAFEVFGSYIEEVSNYSFPPNKLKTLTIQCSTNNLTIDWSEMKQLESLNLYIRGQIQPPNVEHLKELRQLSLFNDEIDSLPDEFFNLPSIRYLFLHLPKMKNINESIGNLETLWRLEIREAYFIDRLPETLSKLKELRGFGISTTDRIGSIAPLSVLPNLERLSIEGVNPLLVIEDLIAIEKLKYLYMSLAPLYQQDLTPLGQLKKIKQIQFGTRYVEKYDEKFVQKELSDSVKNEIYDQLKLVLPKRFFKI